MEIILVVNINQQAFFESSKDTYEHKLKELLTPYGSNKLSHWSRKDKIVFCPTSLENFVKKNYNELYL
jgi:hypothetical protein